MYSFSWSHLHDQYLYNYIYNVYVYLQFSSTREISYLVLKMVKQCDRCKAEFKGFGTTCPECRRSGPAPNSGSTPASSSTACIVCNKTVYAMEKLVVDGALFHKDCFRCKACNGKLSIGKFSRAPSGEFFCPTHFKELFRLRGKYDEDPSKLKTAHDSVINSAEQLPFSGADDQRSSDVPRATSMEGSHQQPSPCLPGTMSAGGDVIKNEHAAVTMDVDTTASENTSKTGSPRAAGGGATAVAT
ncbi:unnamed protein product [Amoebophrya sp. A25]|nr:unnamed protein product [Amoebophrya sp. A25]|eukprot:GSA25T00020098001.1